MNVFFKFSRLTVIPGPPLFSLTVQLLEPFPRRVESITEPHTGRDCIEGNPPGTIHAAFVLWATQLEPVRVHFDEFATGTARRVVVSQRKGGQPMDPPRAICMVHVCRCSACTDRLTCRVTYRYIAIPFTPRQLLFTSLVPTQQMCPLSSGCMHDP